ncbi:MAG: aminofutalosine synthase MqnE, partial [Proteobacteria bacterium]|nr:aminofutalosine synthase MqnE [Pseudomonadota bacterium]
MRRLRDLQDETSGFNVFIPLSFQPFQNEMGIARYTFGADDLRTIAVARLFLDNFKNIKSYWVMLGQDIAQLALNFGANDLDGTVLEEKISRAAGGRSGMIMTRNNLESLIRRSG